MNHPRSYLFIIALCLAVVAIADATPKQVLLSPLPSLQLAETGRHFPVLFAQIIRRKPTPTSSSEFGTPLIPRKPKERPPWFNVAVIVGVITVVTGLITAIAQLIGAVRKR